MKCKWKDGGLCTHAGSTPTNIIGSHCGGTNNCYAYGEWRREQDMLDTTSPAEAAEISAMAMGPCKYWDSGYCYRGNDLSANVSRLSGACMGYAGCAAHERWDAPEAGNKNPNIGIAIDRVVEALEVLKQELEQAKEQV